MILIQFNQFVIIFIKINEYEHYEHCRDVKKANLEELLKLALKACYFVTVAIAPMNDIELSRSYKYLHRIARLNYFNNKI